ncbi:hypothetical protein [Streptomyces canus]|uniref:hypothetical protein n=1 Tax=Streptomyces canus TaxID=58343 RepID=UPI00224D2022|nr:hypothetical protein [Streptomyces canus]MCX4853684.1 hypothetical protein [Streptomyces canus]
MLLKPGTTCDQAIEVLEDLTEGLNNLHDVIPDIVPDIPQRAASHVVRQYDNWTHQATAALLKVFADRSVADRLRGERYHAIMRDQFPP